MDILGKLKKGLSKTREILLTDVDELFSRDRKIDAALLDELEEILVMSDVGIDITSEIMDTIGKRAKNLTSADELKALFKDELKSMFPKPLLDSSSEVSKPFIKPCVIMVVGVNGTGKTTTLGKLALKYSLEGKKVLIAAADTFRAAAIEQVEIWAQRAGVGIVKHKAGADPAAVAFDGVDAAIARGVDILLIDTAGRLHTQKNLMEELKKIKRSVSKRLAGAPHQVLMVLDATTGQNALSQAKLFNEAVGITELAMTKLDGTAKGGIVIAVAKSVNVPLKYIGVGEGIDDLQDFDPESFVNALFD
ncbi:MAG: signal recognition particle-docking protein FtsY [Desulfamplus sp.]|nr:signal recognition particle-docking protein FtsY [Desulfamplus sp.]MBF0390188.1 signal recognition particle-docking protein FtsY [Desulfamplus sp.]